MTDGGILNRQSSRCVGLKKNPTRRATPAPDRDVAETKRLARKESDARLRGASLIAGVLGQGNDGICPTDGEAWISRRKRPGADGARKDVQRLSDSRGTIVRREIEIDGIARTGVGDGLLQRAAWIER